METPMSRRFTFFASAALIAVTAALAPAVPALAQMNEKTVTEF
jgi:hypothetical protein